jgi:hypothetical protein
MPDDGPTYTIRDDYYLDDEMPTDRCFEKRAGTSRGTSEGVFLHLAYGRLQRGVR